MRVHITVTDAKGNNYEGTAELIKVKTRAKQKGKAGYSIKPRKPSEAIHRIYLEEFFKDERKLSDVHAKLKSKGYNFKKGSITMALKGADYLIKNGRKGNYTFIQKYPPR